MYFVSYDLEFTDGSTETKILQTGTKEQCEFVFDSVPAVVYKGKKKVKTASLSLRENEKE